MALLCGLSCPYCRWPRGRFCFRRWSAVQTAGGPGVRRIAPEYRLRMTLEEGIAGNLCHIRELARWNSAGESARLGHSPPVVAGVFLCSSLCNPSSVLQRKKSMRVLMNRQASGSGCLPPCFACSSWPARSPRPWHRNWGKAGARFVSPPSSARPHTWWHWMNGNVTKKASPPISNR